MEKFTERELNDILQQFNGKNVIEIEFEKAFDGKMVLQDSKIEFDQKNGFINIDSKEGKFTINVTLIYNYYKKENEIQIDLDTLLIKIKMFLDGYLLIIVINLMVMIRILSYMDIILGMDLCLVH